MALVRYEPFTLLDRFQRELNRLTNLDGLSGDVSNDDGSNVVTSHWRPAVDIREEDNRFVILADIPGVDPKDIEVTMDNGMLTIRGDRKSEKEENREGYHRVERVRGTFYRRFSLPDTANAEKISAKGKDGVLEIVLPKHDKVQPRKIPVSN
jgi:HSP20 family protein